jgi:hypothetical protein
MESTKGDSPLKARFFVVRKQIYNDYNEKQQTEKQAASAALKRVMSKHERESEVIEIDNDITAPDASKQTMKNGQCVPMTTSSSGRLFCYPKSRKSQGTRRHASVNRTDTQTSKALTMQMMMTLILRPALRVKTIID